VRCGTMTHRLHGKTCREGCKPHMAKGALIWLISVALRGGAEAAGEIMNLQFSKMGLYLQGPWLVGNVSESLRR